MDFKINDRVRIVSAKFPSVWYSTKLGETFVIDGFSHNQYGDYCMGHDFRDGVYECDIELVKEEKEEMKFDMKKEPWFIRVANEQEYELVQNWLLENYGTNCIAEYSREFKYLTNTTCNGYVEKSWVMHGCGDKPNQQEIKVTFKTVIDSVTFPEVKTEQQKQIEELEKTILLAKQQIEQLKNS